MPTPFEAAIVCTRYSHIQWRFTENKPLSASTMNEHRLRQLHAVNGTALDKELAKAITSTGTHPIGEQIPKLAQATLEELSTELDARRFTSCQLVQTYKRRIAKVNNKFNVVLKINPEAEKIAKQLDEERQEGKIRRSLHGIPVLLKDIYTDNHTSTSAGSYALLGSKAPREATANFRSGPSNGTNGWSARGGQTYGAFFPGTKAEGSSSGSAISAILGLAFAVIRTKQRRWVAPTVGLVARDGILPLSNRQDTVGPCARTVKCAAHILTVISGKSAYDNATEAIPFESIPKYEEACEGTRLDGLRIGVPREAIADADDVVLEAFERALELLASAGATIVNNVTFSSIKEWNEWGPASKRACLQAEFKYSIENWLQVLVENPNNIYTLQDIMGFTMSDPRECYPERDIQRWEWIQEGPDYASTEYQELLNKMYRLAGEQRMLEAMEKHALDVTVKIASIQGSKRDPTTTFAAQLGLPAITVPLGFYPEDTEPVNHRGDIFNIAPHVPFGITFTGKAFTEELLF
ncbi:amidase signature enzyme [Decorospora gaudefroyi]|uniref:Amidase signature enzyme n=1 Tax=Decorospora gaudefroyi TaxID=184978 RepID=A0A6A5KKJ6_9PLEO|nr:amidase signature enzyme [Decorospora gaudefroyi]